MFGKLAALHAKNQFSFAIIAGDLFADPAEATSDEQEEVSKLLNGGIEVPLPTYFSLGRNSLPPGVIQKLKENADELCLNLSFLGRRRTIKTTEGIKIVTVGGAHQAAPLKEATIDYEPVHTDSDIKILKGANSADLLITSEWPSDILTGSKAEYNDDLPVSQASISELCSTLKPRYHFTTSAQFYEREPFFHVPEEAGEGYAVTRFISLACFGNTTKQKWIYAFSLDPSAVAPTSIQPGTTASPLAFAGKKRKAGANDGQTFSRYSNGQANGYEHRGHQPKRRRAQATPQECYFCLSNKNLATHMIASIGTDAYLTVAKGPLSTPKTYPHLGFPAHMLIIPMTHSPTMASIPGDDERKSTLAEMQRYREALQRMVVGKSKAEDGVELGAVTWEISRAGGVHHHWQFMPVPADLIRRGLVQAAFEVEAENENYPKFVSKAADTAVAEEGDFMKVMIWTEALQKSIVLPIDASFRFNLQFGRRVLAKLLGLEDRIQWQDTAQTEAEETADAAAFKEAFRPFDFTLEEE